MSNEDRLIKTLRMVDETYAGIPSDILFQVDDVARSLIDLGPRRLPQKGSGTDYYDARPYRVGDDPRYISARLSRRLGRSMLVERQDETPQPIFIWRKGSGTTTVKYDPKRLSKKEYLDVAFLALGKALANSEDKIGVIDAQGLYSGTTAAGRILPQFMQVNIVTGSVPVIARRIPAGSTVILGSDFFVGADKQDELASAIGQLAGMGANGHICMVIDPVELDFNKYKGHIRFHGKEGEPAYVSKKSEALRNEFNNKMNRHIEWVRDLAQSHGFKFTLQRTDSQPLDLVLKLYGLNPGKPDYEPSI